MKHSRGFTLIELMIVVAIIAILTSLAITVYANSITKSQFSESQTVADGLKMPIVEYANQTGNCPVIGAASGISLASNIASYAGKYVATATIGGGPLPAACTIVIAFKPAGSVSQPLVGNTVTFTGTNKGGTFTWICTTTVTTKYAPTACE